MGRRVLSRLAHLTLKRGLVVDVDLEPVLGSETGKVRPAIIVTNNIYNLRVPVIQVVPLTEWSEKKSQIKSNVTIQPTSGNGLSKISVADCLQTRPIDHRHRLCRVRGEVEPKILEQIDSALRTVFGLK